MKREIQKTVLLCLLTQEQELLMIHKKRGQGAGKWNIPGGKVNPQETELAAAIRECQEETGITPLEPKRLGSLTFLFDTGNSWDNECSVFFSEKYTGQILTESDESINYWILKEKIPWSQLWDSDQFWLPLALEQKSFTHTYHFDANNRLVSKELNKKN